LAINIIDMAIPTKCTWSIQSIRDLVQDKLEKRPCYFQIKVAQALYAGKDVVACAPTGAGKTLTFWIPVLMALEEGKDKMSIVVTPLNLLGKQNQEALDKTGIKGIAISCHNASPQTFRVCHHLFCTSCTNIKIRIGY